MLTVDQAKAKAKPKALVAEQQPLSEISANPAVKIPKKVLYILVGLWALVLSLMLTKVWSAYETRLLTAEIAKARAKQTDLNTKWSKLLVERQTWMEFDRVQGMVKKEGMQPLQPEAMKTLKQLLQNNTAPE